MRVLLPMALMSLVIVGCDNGPTCTRVRGPSRDDTAEDLALHLRGSDLPLRKDVQRLRHDIDRIGEVLPDLAYLADLGQPGTDIIVTMVVEDIAGFTTSSEGRCFLTRFDAEIHESTLVPSHVLFLSELNVGYPFFLREATKLSSVVEVSDDGTEPFVGRTFCTDLDAPEHLYVIERGYGSDCQEGCSTYTYTAITVDGDEVAIVDRWYRGDDIGLEGYVNKTPTITPPTTCF